MKKIVFRVFLLLMITGLFLASCNLTYSKNQQTPTIPVETIVAGTMRVRMTQIAYRTNAAIATQQVEQSFTPTVTETPSVTNTPTVTSTATVTITPTVTSTFTATSTPITPTATAIPCNVASFMSDVTIVDGTSITAGSNFTKTWRIKNTGSCTWTTSYTIYFLTGNSMSAAAAVAFPNSVAPGSTVDLSVAMVAPSATGSYTGSWMLKAPNGSVFGVGALGGVPLTVKINVTDVPASHDPNTIYDFVKNYCSAQWRTNAGFITCPTNGYDYNNGTISRTYAPVLENGVVDDEGTLITIPAYGGDGMVQGQFPKILIHSGDHFMASLACTYAKASCSVTFELLYQEYGTTSVTSLATWAKTYDGTVTPVDVDLSALDGKDIIFYIKVYSQGSPTDDFAQWISVRVTHP